MEKTVVEGKLKTEIVKNQWFEDPIGVHEEPYVAVVNVDDLLKILDEAKKEYRFAYPTNPPEDPAEVWLALVNEHNKWFKKWFGDK